MNNNNNATPDFPVFMALAKTTKFVSRAGAIPYVWSTESGELVAKKTWKVMNLLKQLVLIFQVLFTLYQALYFAQAKEVPLFQLIYAFYLTFGVIILAYNVVLIYGDPGAMQAVINNLIRTSHRFYGNPFS